MNIASCDSLRFIANRLRTTALRSIILLSYTGQREHGGRGRIRTSVARKERQIYSLLVLATHPPVLEKIHPNANRIFQVQSAKHSTASENTKRTRVKRHQPVDFDSRIRSASLPANFLVELAEGIEPPTL
jgi:hypothetical protein